MHFVKAVKPGGHEKRDYYLVDILQDVRAEMEAERLKENAQKIASGENIPFNQMTVIQKIKTINATIDEYIRPMLMMDGGDMEILDIKDSSDGHIDIYIRYMGACNGCASASTGTLFAIEGILQQQIDSNIRVLPI